MEFWNYTKLTTYLAQPPPQPPKNQLPSKIPSLPLELFGFLNSENLLHDLHSVPINCFTVIFAPNIGISSNSGIISSTKGPSRSFRVDSRLWTPREGDTAFGLGEAGRVSFEFLVRAVVGCERAATCPGVFSIIASIKKESWYFFGQEKVPYLLVNFERPILNQNKLYLFPAMDHGTITFYNLIN